MPRKPNPKPPSKPKRKTKAASEGIAPAARVSEEPNLGGRPSGYKPEYVEQARKLCTLGMTDEELARYFEVHVATIYRWQASHPEFCEALKVGKAPADDRVERSLYHRACGYTFDSEKVFNYQGEIVRAKTVEHVPPDTTAAIFWLKNRRKEEWRDRHEVDHSHKIDLSQLSDDELADIAAGRGHRASTAQGHTSKLN